MRLTFVLAALALAFATPCTAQTPTPTGDSVPTADPADVESIDAVLGALYDVISGPAGQARDWDRFRSLFANEAKLTHTGRPADGSRARGLSMSVEDYVTGASAMFERRGFFESEIGRVTEEFGQMAHAFSAYASRSEQDGNVIDRGINSIQLLFDNERWWIMSVMWWSVGPDGEIPDRYLGN